jgi:hypothetical protein
MPNNTYSHNPNFQFDPRTVQPAVSHYTDWATRPSKNIKNTHEITRHEHKDVDNNETRETQLNDQNKALVPVIITINLTNL